MTIGSAVSSRSSVLAEGNSTGQSVVVRRRQLPALQMYGWSTCALIQSAFVVHSGGAPPLPPPIPLPPRPPSVPDRPAVSALPALLVAPAPAAPPPSAPDIAELPALPTHTWFTHWVFANCGPSAVQSLDCSHCAALSS